MSPWRGTATLAAALALLVALDVWAHRAAEVPASPEIGAFGADEATSISIRHGDDAVELSRTPDGWQVTAPYTGPADPDEVAAVLAGLGSGVSLDVRVDAASAEEYGLTGADPVRVDVAGAAGNLASVVVGSNAEGGTTFVRVPGSDDVYRARIGGRSRYAVPPAGWRDHRLLSFPPDRLTSIGIGRPEGSFTLTRQVADGRVGPWTLAGDPAFAVDPVLAGAAARLLAGLRAVDVVSADVPSGLEAPVATLALELTGGERHAIRLGRSGDGAFAAVDDRPEIYRLPPQLVDRLAAPAESWRDHTLLAVDPASVTELVLEEAGRPRVVLSRADGTWRVTEPANVDADPQRAAQVAAYLAQLRVDAWLPVSAAEAGFLGGRRIVVASGSGRATIELGSAVPGRPAGQETVYVRNARQPERIGALPARVVGQLTSAWGR